MIFSTIIHFLADLPCPETVLQKKLYGIGYPSGKKVTLALSHWETFIMVVIDPISEIHRFISSPLPSKEDKPPLNVVSSGIPTTDLFAQYFLLSRILRR